MIGQVALAGESDGIELASGAGHSSLGMAA
jgi:hypothetical protein